MWGQNGITIERKLLDQQASVTPWTNVQTRVPFRQLKTAGYGKTLELWSPQTEYVGVVTLNSDTMTPQTVRGQGVLSAINRFRLKVQNVATLYDVAGYDFNVLAYWRNGNYERAAGSVLPGGPGVTGVTAKTDVLNVYGGNPTQNDYFSSRYPGIAGVSYGSDAAASSTNLKFGLWVQIPLTEVINFRGTVVAGPDGKPVMLGDMPLEVGLITLGNNQQNVQPEILLNPLYSLAGVAPFITSLSTASIPSVQWNLSSWTYDIPQNPADRPPVYSQAFVVSRQSFTVPISGGAATVYHPPGGMLMRVGFYFITAATGAVTDLGNGATGSAFVTNGSIAFKSGSSISKIEETPLENLNRSYWLYNAPPPACLVFDFFKDGTLVDCINTPKNTNLRTEFKGITSDFAGTAPDTVVCVEERLIPVRVTG